MKWKTMLVVSLQVSLVVCHNLGARSKRNVLFLPGSGIGLYLALALPIDLPQYEISMSFNYEANYNLPSNATELALASRGITEVRKARSLTRVNIYSFIETQLESRGLLGKECLLRTICETQEDPILEHNGLIGSLLHLLFTPSATMKEDLPHEYERAEEAGRTTRDTCNRIYAGCPFSLYDFFTIWTHDKQKDSST